MAHQLGYLLFVLHKSFYICYTFLFLKTRFGRNYLEVGNLSEVFLPEHGCELISLSEKLDEMAVFRNMAIALKINSESVTPPKDHYYQSKNKRNPRKTNGLWGDGTVKANMKIR